MSRFFALFLLSLFLSNSASSIEISGNNMEYAGNIFKFYHYSDPVSLNEEFLFEIEFDSSGYFKTSVCITKPTFVFSNFGIYQGLLFLEPGKNINLLFPPFRKKSFAEQKNAFFKPISFWIDTTNNSDLSTKISAFNLKFNQLTNKYFNQLYFRQSQEMYDSVLLFLHQDFPEELPGIYLTHKNFKIKSLETDVFRIKSEDVWESFINLNSDFWNQPAFFDLFEKTFSNKLSFEAKDINGNELRQAIGQGNADFILNLLKTKYKLEGDFAYLTLIKLLHDGFYSGEFSKNAILNMLKLEKLNMHPNDEIKKATKNVIQKLTHLSVGSAAPAICLNNDDGEKECSTQNTEKYKYLVFADVEMIVCREHLKYLSEIQNKFQKHLEIIIVFRNTDSSELKQFLNENKIPGTKLVDENEEYIKRYKIKSFPQCFLLNSNHEIEFEETKAPLDGFEQQFGKYLQKEIFEKLRNQSK